MKLITGREEIFRRFCHQNLFTQQRELSCQPNKFISEKQDSSTLKSYPYFNKKIIYMTFS